MYLDAYSITSRVRERSKVNTKETFRVYGAVIEETAHGQTVEKCNCQSPCVRATKNNFYNKLHLCDKTGQWRRVQHTKGTFRQGVSPNLLPLYMKYKISQKI